MVTEHLDEIDARDVNSIELPRSDIVVRVGKYGPYLERGESRASLPEEIAPDELTPEKAEELLARPSEERSLGDDPETGRAVLLRNGRYGPYVTEELPEDSNDKPKTASLFGSMSPETITLDEALKLAFAARIVGEADGEAIEARNGRYGPYIQKGKANALAGERGTDSSRSRRTGAGAPRRPEAAPRPRRFRRPFEGSWRRPLVRTSGCGQGRPIWPYATDGETNASLRAGDAVESLTLDRAVELLAERRAKGPGKKRAPQRRK